MNKTLILCILLLLSSISTHAAPAADNASPAATSTEGHLESWYWTFGLGLSIPNYPSEVQADLDSLKAAGYSRTPIALDLGFYWPVADQKLIIGPSIHGSTDSYTNDGNNLSITQSGIYFSGMYTFGKEPGSGFIVRGDVGIARINVNVNVPGSSFGLESDSGLGLTVGGGYGFNVSEGTRLILLGLYSYRHIESNNYGDFTITFGPVF